MYACIKGPAEMFLAKDQSRKESPDIRFRVIYNDHTKQSLLWLFKAREIVHSTLVNMPQDYISAILYDKNHRTAILLANGVVVATIVYRPFGKSNFIEMVFCCVKDGCQSGGFGRIIMNHLKCHLQSENICHVVVYADNSAMGYFKRQGFTSHFPKTAPRSFFDEFIKEYDGATPMYAYINPVIDYIEIRNWTMKLIDHIADKLPKKQRKKLKGTSITNFEGVPLTEKMAIVSMEEKMKSILYIIGNERDSIHFQRPISEADNPFYRDFISKPMDLSTIKAKLTSGAYRVLSEFADDLRLIFKNCYTYNEDDSKYSIAARRLEEITKELCTRIGIEYPVD